MFLARPSPFPGESLSSWRQRSGLANGFRLFPLAPGEPRRVDVDLNPSDSTIDWLAEQFAVTRDGIVAMTLKHLDGKLLSFGAGRATPRWVIAARYSRRDQAHGMPFCPICLREDKTPFFRLRWRLALLAVCEAHGVFLLDKCPDCQHPGWPGSIACPTLFKRTWTPPHLCLLCGFDLRLSPVVLAEVDVRIPMAGEFLDSDVPLGADQVVSAATYASAAWSVTQLFIRRRSQALVQDGPTPSSDLVELVQKAPAVRSVEDLPIGVRGRVVGHAHALFDGWPEVLLDLCEACGLSAQHFSADRSTLPSWFDEAIRRTVRRQVRGVSSQEVSEALNRLKQSGDRVSKAAVSRLVGAKQAKAIDEVLDRRTEASVLELFHLTGQLVRATQEAAKRRSSIGVRLRDASMILLSMLCRLELSMVAKVDVDWTQQTVYELLGDHGATEARRHVVQALDAFLLRYAEIQRGLGLDQIACDRTLMFVPFRGDNPCARSAGRMLGQCMIGMDPRLVRSVRSFYKASA